MRFNTLEDVKKYYGEENLIPISFLKQIIFYAVNGCQPKFVWESEKKNGKIVAWYLKNDTAHVNSKWKESRPKK